ncbi:WD40 repeat-like protein [Polyplosphaeria fusca]|uniref:Pre-mRNA-splicing factor PRP46 n=1 Tax=Polyplosphaeria fusca TaxID=682080 RepID=A0A9P4V7R1_9PLEO|nr:WD40 repeat-like protein [Polyplosphaeria fusca]
MSTPEVCVRTSAKRTRELFADSFASPQALEQPTNSIFEFQAPTTSPLDISAQIGVSSRIRNQYHDVRELPPALAAKMATAATTTVERRQKIRKANTDEKASDVKMQKMIEGATDRADQARSARQSMALTVREGKGPAPNANGPTPMRDTPSSALVRKDVFRQPKPQWHAPWKLMRVISGHSGWVRSLCLSPENDWFASGGGDRCVKIWDLASGTLRLTLTGHISSVRGVAVSDRHPYMYTCGEDKKVLGWDLECNKVTHTYHGHLSGVYTIDLHPTMNYLATGGRDAVCRLWDLRTKSNVMVLSGHRGTLTSVKMQPADPQVITSSMDSTVRLWDIRAGKTLTTLTHHKKSVRGLACHPNEWTFATASTNSIKQFKLPAGELMETFQEPSGVVNTISVNEDNVTFAGQDDGSMIFYDWKTGHAFQRSETIAQPGSLSAENGIFCSTFDRSSIRLLTGEADKTIKVWGPDLDADEESHPLDWKPTLGRRKF